MSLEGDTLEFILRRYFGPRYGKSAARAFNLPRERIRSYTTGRHPIPVHIWLLVARHAPTALGMKVNWAKLRKERIDIWLLHQTDYVESARLTALSAAETARKARASRKGNQLNP